MNPKTEYTPEQRAAARAFLAPNLSVEQERHLSGILVPEAHDAFKYARGLLMRRIADILAAEVERLEAGTKEIGELLEKYGWNISKESLEQFLERVKRRVHCAEARVKELEAKNTKEREALEVLARQLVARTAEWDESNESARIGWSGALRLRDTRNRLQARVKELEAKNAKLLESLAGGIGAFAAERRRHIGGEGWTPKHDDEHTDGQLSTAAACYALGQSAASHHISYYWPWSRSWWKPTPENRKREIEKAGALLAAEWDRLDRSEKNESEYRAQLAQKDGAS